MDNVNVSAEQIRTEASNMEQIVNNQKASCDALKASVESARSNLAAMKSLDGQEISRGHVQPKDEEGNDAGPPYDPVERFKLIVTPDLATLEQSFKDFDNAYSEYCDFVEKFQTAINGIKESADIIAKEINEITSSLDDKEKDILDEDATDLLEATDQLDDELMGDDVYTGGTGGGGYGGGGYGGGDYGGGSSGGGASYTPPVYNTEIPVTTEDEVDTKEKVDYGDGDEGDEKDPVGNDPITTTLPYTLPTITSLIMPTETTQTTTTPATTTTPTVTTVTAPVETHSGGGYSGGGGSFTYDAPVVAPTSPAEEKVQEEIASSIDSIISGRSIPQIPTSTVPIAKASTATAKSTGSSVIPAASGIAAAAVIGLGAKAFLDKKKSEEEAEEEEQML